MNIKNQDKIICYCICSYNSNSMKSSNPNSGIYKSDISRTLDTSCNPASNQGGLVICQKK